MLRSVAPATYTLLLKEASPCVCKSACKTVCFCTLRVSLRSVAPNTNKLLLKEASPVTCKSACRVAFFWTVRVSARLTAPSTARFLRNLKPKESVVSNSW